jgi:hypothetical protein
VAEPRESFLSASDALLILRAQERGLGVSQALWMLMAFNMVYALLLAAFVRESPPPSGRADSRPQ